MEYFEKEEGLNQDLGRLYSLKEDAVYSYHFYLNHIKASDIIGGFPFPANL